MKHLPIHPTLLHPLTGLPLQAAGVVGGRTIWPIMGASEDSDDANDSGDSDQSDDSADDDGADKGDDADNDARILIDERTHRKTAETLLAELTGKSKTEVRKLVRGGAQSAREALIAQKPAKGDGDKGDKDVDADAIRREAERDANERANARIVRSEVRALAAETFADPADAPLYVDLSEFEVDDDGEVNADEIKKALAAVIKAKPHLAKTGKGPKPDRSQGPRGGSRPDPTPGVGRLRQAYADSATTK